MESRSYPPNAMITFFHNCFAAVAKIPQSIIQFNTFFMSVVTIAIISLILFVVFYIGYSISVGWRSGNYHHTITYHNSYYTDIAQSMKSIYESMKDVSIDTVNKIALSQDTDTLELFQSTVWNKKVINFVAYVDNVKDILINSVDKAMYTALLSQHSEKNIVGDKNDITSECIQANLFPLIVELMKVDNMRYQRFKQAIQVYPNDISVDIGQKNATLKKLLGDINLITVPMMWTSGSKSPMSPIGRVFDAYMNMADDTKDEVNFLTITTTQFYKDPYSMEFYNIVRQDDNSFMTAEEFYKYIMQSTADVVLYYANFLQIETTQIETFIGLGDWKSIAAIAIKNKTPIPPEAKFITLMRLRVIIMSYDRVISALKTALTYIHEIPEIAPSLAAIKINLKVSAMYRDTYRGAKRPDNKSRDMTPDNYNVYPCVKPWEFWINYFLQMWSRDFGGNCARLLERYWKFVWDLIKNCMFLVSKLIPMDKIRAGARDIRAFIRISPFAPDTIWRWSTETSLFG